MNSVSVFGRLARWLALCAIALQLALSFGHVHLDGPHRNGAVAGAGNLAAKITSPSAPQPADTDGDYCAICASIFLVASSFVPPPAQLPVPFVSRQIEHSVGTAAVFVTARRTPFRSRAPPLA